MLIELSNGEIIEILPMNLAHRTAFLKQYVDLRNAFIYGLELVPDAKVADLVVLHPKFASALRALQKFLPGEHSYDVRDLEVFFLPSEYSQIGLFLEANGLISAGQDLIEKSMETLEPLVNNKVDAIRLKVYHHLIQVMESAKKAYGSVNTGSNS